MCEMSKRRRPTLRSIISSFILSTIFHLYHSLYHAHPPAMTYHPLHLLPLPSHPHDPKPLPTALAIDPFSDLLWVGNSAGSTSALCSPLHLSPNVRFPAHGSTTAYPGMTRGVKAIRVTDREIWTLTEAGVGGRKRGGAPKWNVTDPAGSLRTMSANPINSHEVVAGGNGLIIANTARGDIVRRVSQT